MRVLAMWKKARIGFAFNSDGCAYCGEFVDSEGLLNTVFRLSDAEFVFLSSTDKTFSNRCAQGTKIIFGKPCEFNPQIAIKANNGLLSLSSTIGIGCTHAISALAGLYSALRKLDPKETITTSQFCAIDNMMCIDGNTSDALQIFKPLRHPAAYQGIGCSKEGLSLFGLLNKTVSSVGKALLRHWLLTPLTDLAAINERLAVVEYFTDSNQQEMLRSLCNAFHGMHDPQAILHRIQLASYSVHDLHNLLLSAKSCKNVFALLMQCQHLQLVQKICSYYKENIQSVIDAIETVVDFKGSLASGHVVVQPGANQKLDECKHLYSGLDDLLTHIALQERGKLPFDFPHNVSVAFFPQLGYLLVVPVVYWQHHGTTDLPPFTFHFMSSEYIYYKSEAMYALDQDLGDLHSKVLDMEAEIVRKLENFLLDKPVHEALQMVPHIAALDCLIAFAKVSIENHYAKPSFSDGTIKIVNARHPLQELCVEQFVPNSFEAGKDSRINLILGPNASGKSVFLKQIGLIFFLAQLGCFVPAEKAELSIVDRIFTRLRSQHCPNEVTSAFAIDLCQVSMMLKYSTKKSLVLLDEFGKGTQSTDGIALLASTLHVFLDRSVECPIVLAATHFSEIIDHQLVCLQLLLRR
eukprot:TRINITY_DN3863_c0_g1_i21.p1 TRINITY_DN3863_c0_g1~~TRINITY_DN3863_c0_g1_i21.p1  ORF type:complete len:635 (-),score=88.25 TRINITY_DN3863_c0_g1_i21:401-2305(-)